MRKFICPLLLVLLILLVFHSWFTPGLLSSYDLPFYSQLMMHNAGFKLYAWDWHPGFDGFAGFFSPYSWVFPFIYIPQVLFGKYFGLNWAFIERIVYLYPLLILLIFSPIFFFKTIFRKNEPQLNRGNFYLISVLVYSFNTYSLLLAGGEIFVALAYSLIPLILGLFIKIINNRNLRLSIFTGLLLAIQVMLDPRVTYVTVFAFLLYLLFNYGFRIKSVLISLLIPFIIAGLLNTFWIIPTVLYGKNPVAELGPSYSTSEAVKYLSFAKLEQTISLLQQNWPENIFGKTYFMRWEFLLLPILAYTSLLFIKIPKVNLKSGNSKNNLTIEQFNNKIILFFALLGLIGAFLAKGANDPFGGIYLWMFDHVPGFIMFRDPAKWYPLVAISYSILIPFTMLKLYELLKSQQKFQISNLKFQNLFLLSLISYFLFLILPALSGQLGGMFKITEVPQDYVKLEKFLYNQLIFSRTLWYPSKQHFGFYSNTHPEISAQVLFNIYDDDKLFKKFSDRGVEKLLQEASIKYVIVPYDSEKEIFITDRKYDNTKYLRTINSLQNINWLKPVSIPCDQITDSKEQTAKNRLKFCGLGRIAVFEVRNPKDHFWSSSENIEIIYSFINPTKYAVSVSNAKKGDSLVFDESFDSKWLAKVTGPDAESLRSVNYNLSPKISLNSFVLPKGGSYSLEVYYEPQKWVDIGTGISLISLILTITVLGVLSVRNKSFK